MQKENWKTNNSSHALQDLQEKQTWGNRVAKLMILKSKFECILEASESTRMRMEETLPKDHEDQEKETIHNQQTIWYTHNSLALSRISRSAFSAVQSSQLVFFPQVPARLFPPLFLSLFPFFLFVNLH